MTLKKTPKWHTFNYIPKNYFKANRWTLIFILNDVLSLRYRFIFIAFFVIFESEILWGNPSLSHKWINSCVWYANKMCLMMSEEDEADWVYRRQRFKKPSFSIAVLEIYTVCIWTDRHDQPCERCVIPLQIFRAF